MSRKFSDVQVEVAKLAFPLFSSVEISEYIGCSIVWLEKLAKKHNIKKASYCFMPGQCGYPLDLSGMRFGKLTVIDKTSYKVKKNTVWNCKCECGNIIKYRASVLRKELKKDCNKCNDDNSKKIRVKNKQEITNEICINSWAWSKIRSHAEERGILFEIDLDYVVKLFLKQNKKCALSGLDIQFPRVVRNVREGTASLDRINSNIGYIEGNVQWIHKDINFMKWKHDQDHFIKLCKQIAEYQESKR